MKNEEQDAQRLQSHFYLSEDICRGVHVFPPEAGVGARHNRKLKRHKKRGKQGVDLGRDEHERDRSNKRLIRHGVRYRPPHRDLFSCACKGSVQYVGKCSEKKKDEYPFPQAIIHRRKNERNAEKPNHRQMVRYDPRRNQFENRLCEKTVVRIQTHVLICHEHKKLLPWYTFFRHMSSRLSSVLPLLVGGIVALAASFLGDSHETIRSAILLFALVFGAGLIGPRIIPSLPTPIQWIIGGTSLLALQSILQTIWYYSGFLLGATSDGLCLAGSLLFFTAFFCVYPSPVASPPSTPPEPIQPAEAAWTTFSVVAHTAAALFVIILAQQAATSVSINSPWILFPAGTFVAVAMLFATGYLSSLKSRALITASLVGITFLALASLTTLVYPLGYGFDGFLHRASEAVILETGTLTPAPPSYIGQYTLITWLARVVGISHHAADLWFVAVLSLFLPFAALHLARKKRGRFAILGLLLALPLGILSATTPQNVSYILGVIALLWLIPEERTSEEDGGTETLEHVVPRVIPWIFLLWSLATHPLAGLPFFFAGFALHIQRVSSSLLRRMLTGAALVGSLLGVPLAFSVRAMLQGDAWSWSWIRAIPNSLGWFVDRWVQPATHLALWPDWANWQLYLLTALLFGAALYAAFKERTRRSIWLVLIAFALSAGLSGWLLELTGDFSFLISYERQAYASRLLVVMQLFLLPAALVGIGHWLERAERAHPRIRAAALLLGLTWFSANVYNMLPRHDAAAIGHGWNVGQSDIEAVKFMEKQANGEPYTVLANQTVSAAAIGTLGFKRYVGDIFFYPIPTGGPLYERFLEMMERPDADIAKEAATLTESTLVYVVVNKYWFRAEQLIERLKTISDRTWNVERGASYIFLFDLRTSDSALTTDSGA